MTTSSKALWVYSLAFAVGAVGGAVLIGTTFYLILGTLLLQRLGAIAAVLSVVTGFYVSYRWSLRVREWILERLDPQRYGFGLMLVYLTMFVFLGSSGWRLVLQTFFWRVSPEMTASQAAREWDSYDFFVLKDYDIQLQTVGVFSSPSPDPQQQPDTHFFVSPLTDRTTTTAGDTLWLGYSAQQRKPDTTIFTQKNHQYTFFKKMPFIEQNLYEQAIRGLRGALGQQNLSLNRKIVHGETISLADFKYRTYRWILPFIGLGLAGWVLGVVIATAIRRSFNQPDFN